MCGRYTIRRIDLFVRPGGMDAPLFDVFDEKQITPRFNIAPTQQIPVVRLNKDDARVLSDVRWGLIPHWAKEIPKVQPINARAETIGSSGMFRQAFQRRRCLIPADGFYEWRKLDPKTKQPMFIRMENDGPFAFAGLWERWSDPETDTVVDTATIITTTPNDLMASIHNRMPVILNPADYTAWLDRDTPADDVASLLRPFPPERMTAHPVSPRVNNARNDGPDLVEAA